RVADRVHDERLLRRRDGGGPLVPEADQQVRREADQPPADEQQQQVAALDEHQHREDEERHIGEVAPLLVVAVHVPDGVEDDEPTDTGDDEHHHRAQRIDEHGQADLEAAALQPRPCGREVAAPVALRAQAEERPDRAGERDEDARRRDPAGRDARDAVAGEQDEQRPGERREQAEPRAGDHPRSSESSSTSSVSRLRWIATTRPSPTHTSDAATAITVSAKICPAPFPACRANAMRARFPPFSMISSESSTMIGLRRTRTPSAPVPKRNAAIPRYQAIPGPATTLLSARASRGRRRRRRR